MNETTNETNPVIKAAMANIEANSKAVELHEALKRLQNNPDYKLVIEESYFSNEKERVAEILTEPTVVSRDIVENLMDQLTSIRNVKSHLELIAVRARNAAKYIKDDEEIIAQVENGTYTNPNTEYED